VIASCQKSLKEVITMGEIQRYRVLTDLLEKKIRAKDTSKLLGLSYVHISRLKIWLKEEGIDGLRRKSGESVKRIS